MAGNQAVVSFPTVPSPVGGVVYIVKAADDYKVEVGGPLGLAYLGSDGNVSSDILNIQWTDIAGKPATFPPSAHTHTAADVTSGVFNIARIPDIPWANVTSKPVYTTRWPSFSEVTGKPSTYTPSSHTHSASDITSGVLSISRIPSIPWSSVTGEPVYTTRWPSFSEVTSTPTTLEGYGITNAVATSGGQAISGTKTFVGAIVANNGISSTADVIYSIGTGASHTGMRFNGVFYRNGNTMYLRPNGAESSTGEMTVSTSGNVTANDFYATSDERLKNTINKIEARDRLADLLEFVSFIWNDSGEEDIGVIAQQVQKVAPEYVTVKDDGYLSVNKGALALEVALGLAARVRELEKKLGDI